MAVHKKLKHKRFVRPRELEDFVNDAALSKDDILYVGKPSDGTWEMLCYLKDDGYKSNI